MLFNRKSKKVEDNRVSQQKSKEAARKAVTSQKKESKIAKPGNFNTGQTRFINIPVGGSFVHGPNFDNWIKKDNCSAIRTIDNRILDFAPMTLVLPMRTSQESLSDTDRIVGKHYTL